MAEEDQGTPERHASWIELFFDLVVVAGVAQLAHLLSHGPSLGDVGLYLLVFLAFWISWASFTVYGNVEGDRVRIPAMLLAMLGLAVMVAAVPGIRDQHTTAFVVAYVGLRWLAGAIYQRGQVVVDWPLAQYGGGAVPWLVSVFVSDSARYWLWTAGILIDLLAMMAFSGDNVPREAQRRLDRVLARRRLRRDQPMPILRAAHTESGHLSERMGLFVIIVLRQKPPSTSLLSANEPSVTSVRLPATRTLVTVSSGCSWAASIHRGSSASARYPAYAAARSGSGRASSMPGWLWISRAYCIAPPGHLLLVDMTIRRPGPRHRAGQCPVVVWGYRRVPPMGLSLTATGSDRRERWDAEDQRLSA
jgi:hypothetical protein